MTKHLSIAATLVLGLACSPQADDAREIAMDGSPDVAAEAASHDAVVEAGPRGTDAAEPDDTTPLDDSSPGGGFVPATPEEIAIAGQLEGALLELDCASEEIELQFCHPKDMGIAHVSLAFGGEPDKTYAVVLGVWGVVEGAEYQGGTLHGEHFYAGGQGVTLPVGTSGRPAEYGLVVGGTTYHLNYFERGVAGEHYTYPIEYVTPPIAIAGGSTVELSVQSPDDMINTNHMDTAVMHPPPGLRDQLDAIRSHVPEGQYVYLATASVTVMP
jgi:hypothetical protein